MAGKNTAVFGLCSSVSQLELAVDALKASGFRNDDISVLFPDKEGTRDFAVEKNTKAPEGAATGAGTGAVLGGTLGWLVGIGALAIPGLGPFIAAGPIIAALAGAGVGGAVGGVTGALVGMGIPEFEAKRYEGLVKEGGILLSVHSDNSEWTKKAKEIMGRFELSDVSSAGEASAEVKSPVGAPGGRARLVNVSGPMSGRPTPPHQGRPHMSPLSRASSVASKFPRGIGLRYRGFTR